MVLVKLLQAGTQVTLSNPGVRRHLLTVAREDQAVEENGKCRSGGKQANKYLTIAAVINKADSHKTGEGIRERDIPFLSEKSLQCVTISDTEIAGDGEDKSSCVKKKGSHSMECDKAELKANFSSLRSERQVAKQMAKLILAAEFLQIKLSFAGIKINMQESTCARHGQNWH
ncbi:hypothetical protein DV515_00003125, partial [Chloebia gouldiae]